MIRSLQRRRFAIGAAGLGLAAAVPAWLVDRAGAERRRDQEEGRARGRPAGRLPALRHGQQRQRARRLRRRRRPAARQGLGRQAQARAGHRPEPDPVPAHQQGRPADRLARDHARARQAGPVLEAVRGGDDRPARRQEGQRQGSRRPQGPARRRRPREHAGHRAHRGRAARHRDPPLRRRRLGHAGADVGPGRRARLLDDGGGADREARAGRTPTRRSSSCASR